MHSPASTWLTGITCECSLPVDPDDRVTRVRHRRRPESAALPDYVIPLGRTIPIPMNGAMSRLAGPGFETVVRLRNELRAGSFDVVHVHEPITPLVGWDAACFDGAPVVGTFHAYSAKWRLRTRSRRCSEQGVSSTS